MYNFAMLINCNYFVTFFNKIVNTYFVIVAIIYIKGIEIYEGVNIWRFGVLSYL